MNDLIKVAVDAMGGDNSPEKIIDGIELHHKKSKNVYYRLFGDKNIIDPLIKNKSIDKNFFEIHPDNFDSDKDLTEAIDLHINQIFTETRVKNYLEFRTTDSQIPRFQMCAPAFYKGIFNDSQALDETADLLREFTPEDILDLQTKVPLKALNTPLKKYLVLDIAKSLLEIASRGLDRQAAMQKLSRSEQIFLHPILEIVFENSYCPAEYFLRAYNKDFNQNLHQTLKISKY